MAFRLGEVVIELTLPPEPEADPARRRAAGRIIDAFTDRPFGGNPAAVCLLDDADAWPDEAWMQQVAAEMHLTDTAFAHPLSDGGEADWALRWFTPEVETNLCGHATLATAHAMYRDRGAAGTVRFASRSGVLVAHTADDGTITLDFPAAPHTAVAAPDGLAEALGVTPRATFSTGALGDLIALLDDEAAVRSVTPDLGPMARIARRDGIRGTIVTAAAADPGGGYDFVSRFFAPADGIPEDPGHGQRPHGAHTVLVGAPRSPRPHRPAGLGPRRPRAHLDPRRPRAPHRPGGRRPRRHTHCFALAANRTSIPLACETCSMVHGCACPFCQWQRLSRSRTPRTGCRRSRRSCHDFGAGRRRRRSPFVTD